MSKSSAYPSPISNTTNAIHLANPGSDQAAKAACECGRREEKREPLLGLAPAVVHSDEIKTTRELSGVSDYSRNLLLPRCLPCQLLRILCQYEVFGRIWKSEAQNAQDGAFQDM